MSASFFNIQYPRKNAVITIMNVDLEEITNTPVYQS